MKKNVTSLLESVAPDSLIDLWQQHSRVGHLRASAELKFLQKYMICVATMMVLINIVIFRTIDLLPFVFLGIMQVVYGLLDFTTGDAFDEFVMDFRRLSGFLDEVHSFAMYDQEELQKMINMKLLTTALEIAEKDHKLDPRQVMDPAERPYAHGFYYTWQSFQRFGLATKDWRTYVVEASLFLNKQHFQIK